jgi:5-methylcytosine-specific restriction endonuclease McrA
MTTIPRATLGPLSNLSDQDLLAHLQIAAQAECRATAHLVALLIELDSRRLYLSEGFPSLFAYCMDALHLSESATYNRIDVARTARRFPIILDGLAAGELTLASVRLLAPHLTSENHREVLTRARHKSKREVELLVAALHPRPDVPSTIRKLPAPRTEKPVVAPDAASSEPPRTMRTSSRPEMTPLTPERYKIQFTVSRETHDKLRRAQDLLRHAVPGGDPAIIVDRALTLLVAQLERSKTGATNRPRTTRPGASSQVKAGSRHVPAATQRVVWQRDAGRCAFIGPQGRCPATAFLEYHHVVPFAAGGDTSATNLELRCRKHNQYEADRYFGPLQVPLVREARAVYGVIAKPFRNELALEGGRVKGSGSFTPADAISYKPRSTARR